MSGIVGVVHRGLLSPQVARAQVEGMCATLVHRGPDDEGVYADKQAAIGMRRLAIIAIATGKQPLSNEDRSIWVVFNGEIYNHKILRKTLRERGHHFRTESDTETIVHAYEEYRDDFVDHLRGMFAIAIWDASTRRLVLARDRFGKKPLLYSEHNGVLSFASEFSCFDAIPGFDKTPDLAAIDEYLEYQYISAPRSGFRSIRKLPPAHIAVYENGVLSISRYWQLEHGPKLRISHHDAVHEVRRRVREAIKLRLESEVPRGVFLSGGVDSSIIAAVAQQYSSTPIKTFTVGPDHPHYRDRSSARIVAKHIGSEHHELLISPASPVELLPQLVRHYGEPYGDSSALPSFQVAELAKQHVTVALSGDGADEIFGGYERYRLMQVTELLAPLARWLDKSRGFERLTRHPRALRLSRMLRTAALPLAPRYARWMSAFSAADRAELYTDSFQQRVGVTQPHHILEQLLSEEVRILEKVLHADIEHYLPNDLLVKMDIAGMAASLEVRSPYLDHRLAEFVARLPSHLKMRMGWGKYVLKRAFMPDLPAATIFRKKMGFSIPVASWFRSSLASWCSSLLMSKEAQERGYFRPEAVRKLLEEHKQGVRNHAGKLWSLVTLELWHREAIERVSVPSTRAYVSRGTRASLPSGPP